MKQEKIIPVQWKRVHLGDLGVFSKGSGIRRNEARTGTIPAVRYGEIYTVHTEILRSHHSYISPEVARTSRPIQFGDILFAGSGETKEEIGKCTGFLKNYKAYAGGDIIIFRPNGTDPAFLSYVLNSQPLIRQKAQRAQGDAVVHIYANALADLELFLPPLEEQEAIAEALSDADALIEGLERLIAKKRLIKQGAMQDLMTAKRRLPGFSGEWVELKLGEIASFGKGKGLPKSEVFPEGEVACVHYGSLFREQPVIIRELSTFTDKFSGARYSQSGDVLMPTSDVTPSGLAVASCIRLEGTLLGGDILVIRPSEAKLDGRFLAAAIRNSKNRILELVSGSTVFHIYARDMRRFRLQVPPLKEQHRIVAVFEDMDAEIQALETRLEKARQVKEGMMQNLLTGRIRLV